MIRFTMDEYIHEDVVGYMPWSWDRYAVDELDNLMYNCSGLGCCWDGVVSDDVDEGTDTRDKKVITSLTSCSCLTEEQFSDRYLLCISSHALNALRNAGCSDTTCVLWNVLARMLVSSRPAPEWISLVEYKTRYRQSLHDGLAWWAWCTTTPTSWETLDIIIVLRRQMCIIIQFNSSHNIP